MPLHQIVTLVLAEAERPMTVNEIRMAAEQHLGRPPPRATLKATLATGVGGALRRFRRVRHGVYELEERTSLPS